MTNILATPVRLDEKAARQQSGRFEDVMRAFHAVKSMRPIVHSGVLQPVTRLIYKEIFRVLLDGTTGWREYGVHFEAHTILLDSDSGPWEGIKQAISESLAYYLGHQKHTIDLNWDEKKLLVTAEPAK